MGIVQLLKPGLFIYECVRIFLLTVTLLNLLPETTSIPWLAFASPGILFPLMALFLWLDAQRFRVYLPLFIAGKCAGIFCLLGWSVVFRHFIITTEFHGVSVLAGLVFLSGDLLALAAILLINKDTQKENKPVLEGEQCE